MTQSTETTKATEPSLTRLLINLVRYYLAGRRGFIALAGVAFVAGAAFHWDWLVAAGIAPLLVALAPCALMCALGLCMRGTGGTSCSSPDQGVQGSVPVAQPQDPQDGDRPAQSQSVTVNTEAQPPPAGTPDREEKPSARQ